jgi:hypothetical protein
VLESALDAIHELADGFRLVAGWMEGGNKFKIHGRDPGSGIENSSSECILSQICSKINSRTGNAVVLFPEKGAGVLLKVIQNLPRTFIADKYQNSIWVISTV